VPVSDWFDNASAVFQGRAISQRIVPDDSADAINGQVTETRFAVETLWKGQSLKPGILSVRTCGYVDPTTGEAATCGGNRFVVGSQYVVFAYGRPLRTSPECDAHITPIERAETLLQWLSSKQPQ
jgi:hypothetical protein